MFENETAPFHINVWNVMRFTSQWGPLAMKTLAIVGIIWAIETGSSFSVIVGKEKQSKPQFMQHFSQNLSPNLKIAV